MQSLEELLTLHRNYTGQLAGLYKQYADLKVDELITRRRAWEESPHTAISGRDADATFAVADITSEIFQVNGQIKEAELWLDHITLSVNALLKSGSDD